MATVTINLYYDANPPYTPRMRGFVDAIFDQCFASLDNDKVVIVWILGAAPSTGWVNKTTLNYQLRSTLGAALGADGQTGGWSSNICPGNIAAGVAKTGGDLDVSGANTVAHEVGIHGINGAWGHYSGSTGTHDIGNKAKTPQLTMAVGVWNSDECADLKSHLGVS